MKPLDFNPRRRPEDTGLERFRNRARGGSGRVLPFKRPDAPLRPFKEHQFLRFTKPFLLALAIVGTPFSLALWVAHGEPFQLSDLVVETADGRVSRTWVHKTLRSCFGRNLPRLPLEYVDETLRSHPWVASTDVRKDLPNRLYIRIHEKQAAALLRDGDGMTFIDHSGQAIAPFEPLRGGHQRVSRSVDLLLLSSPTEEAPRPEQLTRALELANEIHTVGPFWADGLSEIEILGEEDFRLWSADLAFPLLVRAGNVRSKLRYLEMLLPQVERRYDKIAAVDLRFERRIVLKPFVADQKNRRTAVGRS